MWGNNHSCTSLLPWPHFDVQIHRVLEILRSLPPPHGRVESVRVAMRNHTRGFFKARTALKNKLNKQIWQTSQRTFCLHKRRQNTSRTYVYRRGNRWTLRVKRTFEDSVINVLNIRIYKSEMWRTVFRADVSVLPVQQVVLNILPISI